MLEEKKFQVGENAYYQNHGYKARLVIILAVNNDDTYKIRFVGDPTPYNIIGNAPTSKLAKLIITEQSLGS